MDPIAPTSNLCGVHDRHPEIPYGDLDRMLLPERRPRGA